MSRISKTLSLALAAALLYLGPSPGRAASPEDQVRDADIRKLMELTGAGALGVQTFQQMLPFLRQMVPGAPDDFWTEVAAKAKPEALVDLMIPIYRKHLSAKDVKDLIAFYETPVGRKVIQVMPAIAKESMESGQAWGQQIAREVIEQAKARGFTVKT